MHLLRLETTTYKEPVVFIGGVNVKEVHLGWRELLIVLSFKALLAMLSHKHGFGNH